MQVYGPPKPEPASGLFDIIGNIFNEIKSWFVPAESEIQMYNPPPAPSSSYTPQPRGIMETRGLADQLLLAERPSKSSSDGLVNIFGQQLTERGGLFKPSPEVAFNLFGRDFTISQGLMIPLGIAILILIIILWKWR
jgi:hypothetical protein